MKPIEKLLGYLCTSLGLVVFGVMAYSFPRILDMVLAAALTAQLAESILIIIAIIVFCSEILFIILSIFSLGLAVFGVTAYSFLKTIKKRLAYLFILLVIMLIFPELYIIINGIFIWLCEVSFAFALFSTIALPLRTLFSVGVRLTARRAKELTGRDCRPPVLLLRSFEDDHLFLEKASLMGQALRFQIFPWDLVTFEELIVRVASPCGPVVALGRPGEVLPPTGAAREWVPNASWQARVGEVLSSCRAVVLIVGELRDHPALRWEIETIFRLGLDCKTIFVLPPIPEERVRRRWDELVTLSGGRLPTYAGGELVAIFGEDGTPVIVRSKYSRWSTPRRWERDYLAALRPAMGPWKSPGRAVAAPRSLRLASCFLPLDLVDPFSKIIFACWIITLLICSCSIIFQAAEALGFLPGLIVFVMLWTSIGWMITVAREATLRYPT